VSAVSPWRAAQATWLHASLEEAAFACAIHLPASVSPVQPTAEHQRPNSYEVTIENCVLHLLELGRQFSFVHQQHYGIPRQVEQGSEKGRPDSNRSFSKMEFENARQS